MAFILVGRVNVKPFLENLWFMKLGCSSPLEVILAISYLVIKNTPNKHSNANQQLYMFNFKLYYYYLWWGWGQVGRN